MIIFKLQHGHENWHEHMKAGMKKVFFSEIFRKEKIKKYLAHLLGGFGRISLEMNSTYTAFGIHTAFEKCRQLFDRVPSTVPITL